MAEENTLPQLSELDLNPDQAFKNDKLKVLLNAPIPETWIKIHPFAKGVKYIPVDKVEFLLDKIFQVWNLEIKNYQQLFNSVAVQVRLHYKDPITNEMQFQDGIGAVQIQTKKDASPADLSMINNNAVMKALPAAESYALKDAAEKLGDLFGRNLNRKDTLAFKASRTTESYTLERLQELYGEKREKLAPEDDMNIQRVIEFKEESSYKKAIILLKKL